MPRCRRLKSVDSVYHIMCRSISDTPLFKNNKDKDAYLKIVKKYQEIFQFKIYTYCLMDTHCHFVIDANGADISSIMHRINQYYAQKYYNFKYKRRGHLFGDRFKSKVIFDDTYLINASAYIHNNPDVIKGYKDCVEKYKYSSLGIYMGIHEDTLNLVDTSFILNQFSNDLFTARTSYKAFVDSRKDKEIESDFEFMNERSEYRSDRSILYRNFKPDTVIELIAKRLNCHPENIYFNHKHSNTEFRAVCALILQTFCGFTLRQISHHLGNITASNVSALSSRGFKLLKEDASCRNIVSDLIRECCA